jgi:asparagine synthase (glutamine-hydrolysing)
VFVCALRPRGEPLSRSDVFGYIARLERGAAASLQSIVEGPFAAVASTTPTQLRGRLGRWRQLIGAGDVRLDNADELVRIAGVDAQAVGSDLELVLAAIDRAGEACIPRILGDFAFVMWDAHAHKLLAVRDAIGVRPLFHTDAADLVLFSSDIGPLQREHAIDAEFAAGFLNGAGGAAERTVWSGIGSVTPGAIVRQRGTVRSLCRYWCADDFTPSQDADVPADGTRFRALLEEAVRTRVQGADPVWAQLSGGLDSSAVVAIAATTAADRLGGTITLVDSLGDGDERAYSGAVVDRYGLRNEQVRDYWAWQDDGEPPPLTHQPTPLYPFFARERKVGDVVRSHGARVMLTGVGADHYLAGTLDYITDMASAGRVGAALTELTTWSVATRQSFWRLGRRYLVEPFLPRLLQSPPEPPPLWIGPSLAHSRARPATPPRAGSRFARSISAGIAALPAWLHDAAFGADIELRHPFLHRPLVEWSMRLPPQQRVRPHARKWVLREALRDLLPENVRTRTTKGGIDGRILWSLQHERQRIDALLRDPILAQLGWIDASRLRHAVEQARCGIPVHNVQLFSALSLETWLAVRAGRWEPMQTSKAA